MSKNNQKNKKNTNSSKNSYATKNNSNKSQKIALTYKDYEKKVDISKENRWSATLGMVSGNFLKLVLVDILFLLLFLPTLALILKKEIEMLNIASSFRYHNAGFGAFYPITTGQLQALEVVQNKFVYLGIIAFAFIGSLAFSGGFFLMRNFVWANGVLTTKDFFKGIKNSYLKVLFYSLILAVIYVICLYSISLSNYYNVVNGGWYFTFAKVCAITIMCFVALIYLFCCSLTVTYKLPLFKTIKVAFWFSYKFFVPNLFFLIIAGIPFILMSFIGFGAGFASLLSMILIFIGIVFAFLVWTSYTQYAFDKVFDGKIDTSVKVKEQKTKKKEEKVAEYIKPVTDSVEIEQLPEMFSRKDLQKLEESKQHMKEDSDKYYQERKNKKENGESDE